MNAGLDLQDLTYLPPYNPFIRSNGNCAKEIHLPDYPPTDFADISYFNTEDDDSDPSTGRYYKTVNNLPWAIRLPQKWKHLKEKKELSWGYLQFPDWAQSGGGINTQWYFFQPDRIDEEYIYTEE
jgi:LruC domain-containing protein